MKKIKYMFVLMCFLLILTFASCSPSAELVGTWVNDEPNGRAFSIMTLNSDGTGSADGKNINWNIDEERREFTYSYTTEMGSNSNTFDYTVSGDTLDIEGITFHRQ